MHLVRVLPVFIRPVRRAVHVQRSIEDVGTRVGRVDARQQRLPLPDVKGLVSLGEAVRATATVKLCRVRMAPLALRGRGRLALLTAAAGRTLAEAAPLGAVGRGVRVGQAVDVGLGVPAAASDAPFHRRLPVSAGTPLPKLAAPRRFSEGECAGGANTEEKGGGGCWRHHGRPLAPQVRGGMGS
jgi:hypothetical protein